MIDSGSGIHVCPPSLASQSENHLRRERDLVIESAGGDQVLHHGQKLLEFARERGPIAVDFEVAEVTRPLERCENVGQ